MNIEKLARKLEPLMPEKVDRWFRLRDMAEPDLRSLLDKEMILLTHKKLGDFHSKILLSLPTERKARGQINLGTILYEKEKWLAGISRSELLQNMAIFGRSGAGKTNVAFHILAQLVDKKIPFLFLDWKRTARHLLPHLRTRVQVLTPGRNLTPFTVNPLVPPPGLEQHLYINQLVDILASAYTLGDGARSLLQKAISECYAQSKKCPTLHDVSSALEKQELKGRATGWRISALRALQSLKFSGITGGAQESQSDVMASLASSNTVVELDGLNQAGKKFLIPLLCLWLYHLFLAQGEREKLKLVIFLEEAHHILHSRAQSGGESIMEMLLRQCREIGIGMIVIDQHPHLISSAVLGNTYTTVCLNLKDPGDIRKAAALSLVDEEDKGYFSQLPVGQGIVKLQDRWNKPFLVQFPLSKVEKGQVTDDLLARYSRTAAAGSHSMQSQVTTFPQVPQVHLYDTPLDGRTLSFIQDIVKHPDDGVRVRYKRLGIATGTGNRLKQDLLAQGWLETQIVPIGRARKSLLRLSESARKAFAIKQHGNDRESLSHEYWKRFYAARAQELGYRVVLEAPRHGGRVDVLAHKNDQCIGVEIETGRSDIVANVRNALASHFHTVIVVATTTKALKTVERKLAKAQLLIPKRIQVVLRDQFNFSRFDSGKSKPG